MTDEEGKAIAEELNNAIEKRDAGEDYDAEILKRLPFFSRDTGAEILKLVYNCSDRKIALRDNTLFANDSLFCEMAFVIDLDTKMLEVYKGFNREPVPEGERFAHMNDLLDGDGKPREFFPVKLVLSRPIKSSDFPPRNFTVAEKQAVYQYSEEDDDADADAA